MDTKATFAIRFSELCGDSAQAEVAQAIGISRATVGYYKSGDRSPDVVTLAKIAQYFGVTSDYLIGLSDAKQPENSDIVGRLGLSEQAVNAICRTKVLSNTFSKKRNLQVTSIQLLELFVIELCSSHVTSRASAICQIMNDGREGLFQENIGDESTDADIKERARQRKIEAEEIASLYEKARVYDLRLVNRHEFVNHQLYQLESQWNRLFWKVMKPYSNGYADDFVGDPDGDD